jgi:hypothetical protein
MSTFEGRKAEVERLQARVAELEAALASPDGRYATSGAPAPVGGANATVADNVVKLHDNSGRGAPLPQPPKPAPAAPATGGLLTDTVDEPWRPWVAGGAHYDRWSDRRD